MDSGEGIDPQFLPHVFEPFRQAETPSTRVHGGLGLGLSIVRYIAEAHGGRVSAHSEGRGKGSTFTVSLPIRAVSADSAPVTDPLADSFKYGNRLRDLEIMVVDDDQASRKIVSAVLSAAGAHVTVFESAAAALDAVERRQPDIIITDIAMPEVDGYAFARTLRKRDRDRGGLTKIVALSAFPAAMEERGTFDAYLSKPIDPFQLVDEIARATQRASA
jgi:CheY-like chemotaxis protein